MQVGDYVRTEKGIARIIGKNDDVRFAYPDAWITDTYLEVIDDTEYLYDEDIIKSSPNIINLIEEGDFINGEKVEYIEHYYDTKEVSIAHTKSYNYYDMLDMFSRNNGIIKSIITKEQIESIKYEVE